MSLFHHTPPHVQLKINGYGDILPLFFINNAEVNILPFQRRRQQKQVFLPTLGYGLTPRQQFTLFIRQLNFFNHATGCAIEEKLYAAIFFTVDDDLLRFFNLNLILIFTANDDVRNAYFINQIRGNNRQLSPGDQRQLIRIGLFKHA